MTTDIFLTLAILLLAVVLFISEKIRVDLVALIVLGLLALTGLVTSEQALSGFSNPAVVTVWAVFVLSGGLSRTGVANIVGQWLIRMAGSGEVRLMIVLMLVAGLMSAFMNNVGVVALLLPVAVNIARRTGRHPSRLLMPLAFGALLGGMTTLIGTPANILASDALRDAGLQPFAIFDYVPIGGPILLAGILYMILIGRRLLPKDKDVPTQVGIESAVIKHAYHMDERLSVVQIPPDSPIAGKTIAESRLGSAVGLTILRIDRSRNERFIPHMNTRLKVGDCLIVSGKLDVLNSLRGRPYLQIESDYFETADLVNENISIEQISLSDQTNLAGKTLQDLDFRKRFGVIVLALWRDEDVIQTGYDRIPLRRGDTFLVQGKVDRIAALKADPNFVASGTPGTIDSRLVERLQVVKLPENSPLANKTLAESRLAETAGLAVLGIVREGVTRLLVDPQEVLEPEDKLIVKGKVKENLEALEALQGLVVESQLKYQLSDLETDDAAIVEAVLSPHADIIGRTLEQIDFRRRYDLNVLSILRESRVYRSELAKNPLRFGDTFLIHGSRDQLSLLSKDRNFILLTDAIEHSPRVKKAPLAVLIMFLVVLSVMVGLLPIAVAAIVGAILMVLLGCLTMEEAHEEIEWRAVFLIAGMLPLGIAMDTSGTASMLANGVISLVGNYGPTALLAGLFTLTALASQVMPNPVVTVLMAPVALTTAGNLGLSPYPIMIIIAIGASSSFLTPVAHPSNTLILGPGDYRFVDFIKVGLPLSIVVLAVALLTLPLFWPM